MPQYRVKKGRSINQNGVIKKEGDTLEVDKHVAYELRSDLEPVDEEGEFPTQMTAAIPQGDLASMRLHERKNVLTLQKESLEKQLKDTESMLSKVTQESDAEVARVAEAHKARREASAKPAVPASVGSATARPAVAASAEARAGAPNSPAAAPTADVVAPDRPTADQK